MPKPVQVTIESRRAEANRKVQAMVHSLVAEYDARIHRTEEEVQAEKARLTEWKQTKAERSKRSPTPYPT